MARKTRSTASPKTPGKAKKAAKEIVAESPKPKAKAAKKEAPKKETPKEKEFGFVSESQVGKAVAELRKYTERAVQEATNGKSALFEEEENDVSKVLTVQLEFKKFFTNRAEFKQRLVAMAKPFKNAGETLTTCLFLRDNFVTNDEQLAAVEAAKIPTLKKILTLTELKTVYKTFEKRRELYDTYDLFLVDDAILSSMPSVLGKTFYNNTPHKFPVCIKVSNTKNLKELSLVTLANQVNKVLASTQYLAPLGTSLSIQVGYLSGDFSDADLVANVGAVLKTFSADKLVSAGIQTASSPVVPLYYTDKIYDDADVLENAQDKSDDEEATEDVYTKALLELADEDTVMKTIGPKKRSKKSQGAKP